jgi:D-tyrosyl-tRNA(Tyr) deacylase
MRVLLQRVKEARIVCSSGHQASIGRGLVALVGVERRDGPEDVRQILAKLPHLRLFPDAAGVMNLSLLELNSTRAGDHASGPVDSPGDLLVVSQFTLHADTARGRRPFYGAAADPAQAVPLLEDLIQGLRTAGLPVESGRFGDQMDITLVADGPVTLMLDTRAT